MINNCFKFIIIILIIWFLVIIKTYLRDANQIKAKVYRAECMHRAFTIKDEYYPNSINVCADINSYKLKTENRY